jgi:glycosyltransferase involved in cell wall biosynthesis
VTTAHGPRVLRILGSRGIPAAHGGFETFAEKLALDLCDHGWQVVVYCQDAGRGPIVLDEWSGVQRVRIPVSAKGAAGTILFDAQAIRHAAGRRGLCLTLGYNTAVLCSWLRLNGIANVINMDGLEWQRAKWGRAARLWLWANEWLGGRIAGHLVADHPEIARHLHERGIPEARISMIPYGAERVADADPGPLHALGLHPGRYLLLVARPEPENSILEIVRGFVAVPGAHRLVILGSFDAANGYHRQVKAASDERVLFAGAVYDRRTLHALRRHALAHAHGHRAGGTNPSLVEALGAGSAVIAHDNRFNRWVAADAALYFHDAPGFARCWQQLLDDPPALAPLRQAAVRRFERDFAWQQVLSKYRELLERFLD